MQKPIRARFPVLGAAGLAGAKAATANGSRELPEQPTEAPPHSEAKITELSARAAQGVSLWHPADRPEIPDAPVADLPAGLPAGWMSIREMEAARFG